MKKFFLSLLLVSLTAASSYAQDSSRSVKMYLSTEAGGATMLKKDSPILCDFSVNPGCRIGNFQVFVPVTLGCRLWETEGLRNFSLNGLLGLGAGYSIPLGKAQDCIEINLSCSPTVIKDTYDYLSSRMALNWCARREGQRIYPYIGLSGYCVTPYDRSLPSNFYLGFSIGFGL